MEVDPSSHNYISGKTSMVDTPDNLCLECTAKVYRDDNHPDLKFLYCSPQCRDRSKILCDSQKKLIEGYRDLEKKMKSLDTPVLKYPSNTPPPLPLSSSAATAAAPSRNSYERGAEGPSITVKHQETIVLYAKKRQHDSMGLIISPAPDKDSLGAIITGVDTKICFDKYLQHIHLLDVLIEVDSQPVVCSKSSDQLGIGMSYPRLEIYRPIPLPDMSKFLLEAHHKFSYSHVFAMKSKKGKDFGVEVRYMQQWKGVGIASLTTDSIGFSCGLKFEDIIRTCIIVQDKLPSFKSLPKSDNEDYEKKVRHTLKIAISEDNNVVLLIINRNH